MLKFETVASHAKWVSRQALDLLFPALCPNCAEAVGHAGALCATCWHKINFITDPKCVQCGYPFDFGQDSALKCANCLIHPPGV